MAAIMRKSGVHIMGDVPWGTHFCQFYKTKEDLIDILVPYFKAGLENNEFCMWVTSEPLSAKEATEALAKQVKDPNAYIAKGQIEILDYSQWYPKSGRFDAKKVLAGWVDKEKQALDNGFDGLRLTGNTLWLEQEDRQDFVDYEAAVNSVIGNYRMIALCTYSLDRCTPSEIIDVVSNHEFALIRREHNWHIIESAKHSQTVEALRRSRDQWELTFNSVPDLIAIIDTNYRIVRVNRAMADKLGCRADEAAGLTCYEVIHGTDSPPEYCPHRRLVEDGRQHSAEIHEDRLGGDFAISVTPLRNADGQVTGSVHVARNITDRMHTEAAVQEALAESRQRTAEMSALLEGSRAVLAHREFVDAARSIFDTCKNLIGAAAGYVALLTEDGMENDLVFLDSGGRTCTVDQSLPMPIRGLRGEAYRTGRAVYHNDFADSEWAKLMPEGHATLDNVLFAPLVIEQKVVGLLGLANKQGGFTENDARMATAFGELAAVALRNSRALESLERSEQRFRSVAETASDGIISIDGHGKVVLWNRGAESTFGYSAAEMLGKSVRIIMPERFRKAHQEAVERILSTGESKIIGGTVELAGLRKDGREFPLELSVATWKAGEEAFFTAIVRDITERKRAEEAMQESQEKFRNLAEQSPNMIFINKGGRIAYANTRCEEVMGYTREEFYSSDFDFVTIIAPESRDLIKENYRRHLDGQDVEPVEYTLITKMGTKIYAILATKLIQYDGQNAILGTVTDITDRKHAEQALRESEKQLSTRNRIAEIFLTTPDDEIYAEVLQVVLEAMESRYGIFGYLDEQETLVIPSMTRDIWEQCQVPDKTIVYPREKWGGIWGRALEEKTTIYANEGLNVPEGHVAITRVLVVPILYGQRRIGLLEVANRSTDYSEKDQLFLEHIAAHMAPILSARLERDKQQGERRQAEEALRESEQKHRRLVETMSEGLGVTDANYLFTYVNDKFCRMLGYSREQVLHRHLLEFVEDDYKQFMEDQIIRRKKGEAKSYEIGWKAKDGRTVYTLISPAGQFDDDGNFVGSLGVLTDISERREAEVRQQLAGKILQVLNQEMGLQELIHEVITLVKQATGFAAVGMRLRDGEQFPYFEVDGFSDDFVRAESDLCGRDEHGNIRRNASGTPVLECMCGCVLSGHTEVSSPFFTDGGSFWTNSTSRLLRSREAQGLPFNVRGRCNRAGYESVALIPLRSGAEIVGLLQLNDTSAGRFTQEIVGFFEQICTSVGIALARAKAEEALKRSEERYALAQRAAHIGSWDWNIVTGQLLWSEQIEPMFGFGPEEFGRTYEAFLACVHPEDRSHVTASVDACVNGEADYAIEHRIVWPDGMVRWVSETGDVVRDQAGRAVRMLGIVQDITERKHAEQQIESIAKFPSENPCAIVRVEADGAILYANKPAEALLCEWGCTVGQHVPKHWHQYVCRILSHGASEELETPCGDRILSVLMAPVVDAGYVNLYGIDITERKKAEEDLRQYRQHLEELVEARTAELQETNDRLLREIEQRKELERQLLAISEREKRLIGQELHDSIGQQFTGIAFMTKVLEKRIAGKLPEEAAGAAEISKLVNEAMSQTRVLAKGLHPVDLDAQSPASALQELAATTEHLFGVNCSFTCDKPVAVADATVAVNLYRIAQEAVTNAIKHGKAKNIRIALVSNAGQSVLSIKNDGLDFESVPVKHEGMGLNIMHHRAEIINGSLDIRKGASGGAEIVCTFQNIQR